MKYNSHFIFIILVFLIIILINGCLRGCPKIAKICPDGSSVGANPLKNCEFDPCPSQLQEKVICGGWNTFEEVICECNGKYEKPSCPINAQCDGVFYYCYGYCGDCKCYNGDREISCDEREKYWKGLI